MKRLQRYRKGWLASWLLMLWSAWPLVPQAAGPFASGLLWEIRSAGRAPSYLFGTIHAEDPRVTELPAAVDRAFSAADRLVLEIDLNVEALQTVGASMLLPEDTTLNSLIGTSLYQRTAQAMAGYGIPDLVLNRMKPWAAAITLIMPRAETGRFLDMELYLRAVAEGKQVVGLETVAEQTAVFDGMSMAEQIELLTDTVAHLNEIQGQLEDLIRAYVDRDLERLRALNDAAMSASSASLAERFQRTLVVERNHRMAQRMQTQLEAGNAFIAVGALHLPGEEGILQLLQQRGYELRVLY